MKSFYSLSLLLLLGTSCSQTTVLLVRNDSLENRTMEMVSIPYDSEGSFVLLDSDGREVAYQLTYDKQLIFQSSVPANSVRNYRIKPGTPAKVETITTGKQYPERVDDIAWENDRIAFRLYGPALAASGEKAYGYDIWAKRVATPVVEERYRKELQDKITYHKDNGNGLDYYKVGPTLGAGTTALVGTGDSLLYPYCYETFKVLDNGPLRFTVELTYPARTIEGQANVVETRLLSLDAGTHLNRVSVRYKGLKRRMRVATGIVLHDSLSVENGTISSVNNFIAYADPKSPVNGQQYIALYKKEGWDLVEPVYFGKEERKERGALGHFIGFNFYEPGSSYTYYFGAGWSKWGFDKPNDWFLHMEKETNRLQSPLKVSFEE